MIKIYSVRFGPHQNSVRNHSNAVFLLFCTAFVRQRSYRCNITNKCNYIISNSIP